MKLFERRLIMKKYLSILLLGLLLSGCAVTKKSEDVTPINETDDVVVEKEVVEAPYTLVEKEFNEGNVSVTYVQMDGYAGELTQDYINQSLIAIVEQSKNDTYFESIEIKPVIWMTSEDVLCITYEGIGTKSEDDKREILQPVLIDLKSSNEITYENLINDDAAVRALIEEKVINDGLAEYFEAEGIRVYMNAEFVTFAYVPLDDSAKSFIRVSLPIESVKPYLNTEFGEHPAS
jgi:hypothetical protein